MSQLTSSLFALLDFDPPHQPIPFPDNPHGSVCDLERVSGDSGFSPYGLAEGFHRVEDSYSNDEALLVLLEELQPGSASGRLEDPDPGMFVESIGFDSDPSHMEILDVLLEDLSPYEGEEEPRWEELHRAARGGGGGVSGMEIDVLVDPALDFEEPVGVADLSELHLVVEEEVLDLDYGAFLEQLLSDEDVGGRRGSAPAAKKVVENLPLVELGKEDLERGAAVCAVCKDEVDEGQLVNRLPCYHYFHRDCILPWLRMRSTCPVCRFVLPSNDQRV